MGLIFLLSASLTYSFASLELTFLVFNFMVLYLTKVSYASYPTQLAPEELCCSSAIIILFEADLIDFLFYVLFRFSFFSR